VVIFTADSSHPHHLYKEN